MAPGAIYQLAMVDINPQLAVGILLLGHLLGILKVHAIMNVQLPQSAIAWSLSLIRYISLHSIY